MATPQPTFNTRQTAILMADFHREGMGDNPMVQERGTVYKARAVLEAARQAGVLVVYIVVNFRPGYPEIVVGACHQWGHCVDGALCGGRRLSPGGRGGWLCRPRRRDAHVPDAASVPAPGHGGQC